MRERNHLLNVVLIVGGAFFALNALGWLDEHAPELDKRLLYPGLLIVALWGLNRLLRRRK